MTIEQRLNTKVNRLRAELARHNKSKSNAEELIASCLQELLETRRELLQISIKGDENREDLPHFVPKSGYFPEV